MKTQQEIQNYLEGNWHQLKGSVKEKWGKLTDDKLDEIQGRHENLVGILQKDYNLTEEQAKKDIDEFLTASMK